MFALPLIRIRSKEIKKWIRTILISHYVIARFSYKGRSTKIWFIIFQFPWNICVMFPKDQREIRLSLGWYWWGLGRNASTRASMHRRTTLSRDVFHGGFGSCNLPTYINTMLRFASRSPYEPLHCTSSRKWEKERQLPGLRGGEAGLQKKVESWE